MKWIIKSIEFKNNKIEENPPGEKLKHTDLTDVDTHRPIISGTPP